MGAACVLLPSPSCTACLNKGGSGCVCACVCAVCVLLLLLPARCCCREALMLPPAAAGAGQAPSLTICHACPRPARNCCSMGLPFAGSATDWQYAYAGVPAKLRQLAEQGYVIAIFSNQVRRAGCRHRQVRWVLSGGWGWLRVDDGAKR